MSRVFAPGRVNIIGEHTDYTGGLVLPMALDSGITIEGEWNDSGRLHLTSSQFDEPLDVALPITQALAEVQPAWGRYVAAAAKSIEMTRGFKGSIESTLPSGGTGLSSSSALACAALLLFDGDGDRTEMAKAAREIEFTATGVNSGLMDQLCVLHGVAGHALRIDCGSLDIRPVALPSDVELLVFHSGQPRMLADSEYNERRATCEAIESLIGPLREATIDAVLALDDPVMVKRGRHVVRENARVDAMIEAFASNDLMLAGEILEEGHKSLSTDYEVSTPIVDAQQARIAALDGVHGARLTGGGFGGSLVALVEPGLSLDIDEWWMRARPGVGAVLEA